MTHPARNIILFLLVLVLLSLCLFLFTKKVKTTTPSQNQSATTLPSPTSTQMANPASVYCVNIGGTLAIQNGRLGEYGLCNFQDGRACEEWALFRGDCPKGGVKTTGYDTIAEKYCAWVGGKTLAVKDAKCTLPNGKICSDEAYYKGTCPKQ